MNTDTLPRSQLLYYSVLAAPVAFAGYPLYVLAPDFYTTQQGLSLAVLGGVLLVLRLFDAIQDPWIGYLSDRFKQHSALTMQICGLVLVLAFIAVFHPSENHTLAWFCLTMLLAVTAYSVMSINLNSLGALWTADSQQQTRLNSLRESCALVGLLLAVSLPTVLTGLAQQQQAYRWLALTLAALMLIGLGFFSHWHKKNNVVLNHSNVDLKKPDFKFTFLSNKTKQFFVMYGLSVLASSIPAVLVIFFVRDRLASEQQTGLLLLCYFLAAALSMPLWLKLSRVFGKYRALFMSMLLCIVAFIWAFFLESGDVWPFALICIGTGASLGAELALPPSILADHIHHFDTKDHAASQFSLLTLLSKLALALASAIALPLLDWIGFLPAAHNEQQTLLALSAIYALLPCGIKLIAAFYLYHFFIRNHGALSNEPSKKTFIDRSCHHVK